MEEVELQGGPSEDQRQKEEQRQQAERRREDELQQQDEERRRDADRQMADLEDDQRQMAAQSQSDALELSVEEPRPSAQAQNEARQQLSSQAMHALVRLNEQRNMLDTAGSSLRILSRVKTTLMWVVMLLFMWNWMELEKFDLRFKELGGGHGEFKCSHVLYGRDYVLDTWYSILICVTPIGRLLHADCILKRCCAYQPDLSEFPFLHRSEEGSMNLFPETLRPGRPLRVQLLTLSFLVFHVSWSIIGIYYCCLDDPCRNINPHLALCIGIMCGVMIVYVGLSQISHLQVAKLVSLISQDDVERAEAVSAARLAGCLEIEMDSAGLVDGEELPIDCPICMDAMLDEAVPQEEGNRLIPGVCKTPCGHIFHASCLQHWAGRSGSCPLCRSDLSNLHGDANTRIDGPAAVELRQLLMHLETTNPDRAEVTRSILGMRGR